MKRRTLFFLVLAFFSFGLAGQDKLKMNAGIAASKENLTWSIAGNLNGANPNVFSELDWSQITGVGYYAGLGFPVRKRFSGFLDFSQGLIVRGRVTDTDYRSDDRRDQVFFAEEDAGKGQVINAQTGLAFNAINTGFFAFSFGAGYGLLNQQLYLVNEGKGLNSRYSNHWYGPLTFGKVKFVINDALNISAQTTYHQVKYRAVADWNLIEEFQHPVSFSHKAKGFGLDNKLSLEFRYKSNLNVLVSSNYGYWTTGKGIDKLYKSDQSTIKTRLNDVTRSVISFNLGLVVQVF